MISPVKIFTPATEEIPVSQRSKGGESTMEATEVRLKKGEPVDRALRRLKKKLDKEGTLKELRNRRHYEKPSEIKRRTQRRRG
jgi:small subunit ribosomal protein S21